jgi:hypothetical protein
VKGKAQAGIDKVKSKMPKLHKSVKVFGKAKTPETAEIFADAMVDLNALAQTMEGEKPLAEEGFKSSLKRLKGLYSFKKLEGGFKEGRWYFSGDLNPRTKGDGEVGDAAQNGEGSGKRKSTKKKLIFKENESVFYKEHKQVFKIVSLEHPEGEGHHRYTIRDTNKKTIIKGVKGTDLRPESDQYLPKNQKNSTIVAALYDPGEIAKSLRSLLGFGETGVGEASISVQIKIGLGVGIHELLELSASPYVGGSGSINIQDDRRLRASLTLTLGAIAEAKVFKVLNLSASIETSITVAGAFKDVDHLGNYISGKIGTIVEKIKKRFLKKKKEDKKPLSPQEAEAMQKIVKDQDEMEALAKRDAEVAEERKGPSVSAEKIGVKASGSASAGGKIGDVGVEAGVGGSISESETHFTRTKDGKQKVGTTYQRAVSGSLTIGPVSLGYTGTYVNIDNDANPDNDGTYLNLSFTISGPYVNKAIHYLSEKAPEDLMVKNENVRDAINSSFKNSKLDFMKDVAEKEFGGAQADLGVSGTGKMEFNYVEAERTLKLRRAKKSNSKQSRSLKIKEIQFVRQYVRVSKLAEASASVDVAVPLTPGAFAKAGYSGSASLTVGLGERLGSKTLSYIITVFDGLLNRGERGKPQWASYKESHKGEIEAILKSVGKKGSVARNEARGIKDGRVKGTFIDYCSKIVKKDGKVDQAMLKKAYNYLDVFLHINFNETKKKAGKTWK